MERYLIVVAIATCDSTCCMGASPEIRLPPFSGHDRKGSYDVEIKRTEFFDNKVFPVVEGKFHIDVTDICIRVVTRHLAFRPSSPPKYQSEHFLSKRNGSLLTISTETGIAPSRIDYGRKVYVDDEASFYSGFHGVSVINGCFSNLGGSLWDDIRKHADAVVANKSVLPMGVEVELLKREGYWLLRRVRIQLDKSLKQLYSPKFYNFKPPSINPLSSTERLDCEYGVDEAEQKFRYELMCKYEGDLVAGIRIEIAVKNYQPEVATLPLSDDGVYTPTIVSVPNGTDVGVVDETTIEYMWKDGRIVKRIDGTAIDAAESVFFRRGSRLFLVICTLLVTLVLIGLWVVRLRRKASS